MRLTSRWRRGRLALIPAALLVASSMATAPAPAEAFSLSDEVQRLIDATALKKARIGVSIRDDSGRAVVSIHDHDAFMPASNMKLLTTGTALTRLGADFIFQTKLLQQGDRLTVVGDGDPAFGDPELLATVTHTDATGRSREGMSVETLLTLWVDAVKAANVAHVKELVVDDRIFAREFTHPGWPVDQLNEKYCAEVTGLNFHLNRLHLYPRPSGGPRPDISRVEPAVPFLTIQNKATTHNGKKDENAVWVSRTRDQNDLAVNGNVKSPIEAPIPAVVHDMPSLFGEILADRLRKAGVSVDSVRLARADEPPPAGNAIGPIFRTPIAIAVERANTDSENLYAECLGKRVGAKVSGKPGSWENGCGETMKLLHERIGAEADLFKADDGCGLSRGNRVTPAGLTAWVRSLASDPKIADVFLESLAVGGRSGTLKKRFRDLDPSRALVQCKTGYIDGVCCLTGFVTDAAGRRWTFSVLGNSLSEANAVGKVKQLQEQIARAMVRSMSQRAKAPDPAAAVH